ncbi:DUF58 domain-containing protein [Actinomyces lilanjuaniae]|uniref:DUF58 domain-containing protein n=1 Tax=Actinomyces lilanjuaniae TaxID=2321394 RepID=A0ABN5PQ88_9ACTO|nr:DUF58 domain-containing protein [Actinomyces lilanjuaniae]AYD89209.1 DUF58 domain-containing protein [Actinomyces lilanjuaniae]
MSTAAVQRHRLRARWGVPWAAPTPQGWGLVAVGAVLAGAWWLTGLRLLACAALVLAAPVLVSLSVVGGTALVSAVARPRVQLDLPALPQVGERVLVGVRVGLRLPVAVPAWVLWRVDGVSTLAPVDRRGCVLGLEAARRGPAVVGVSRLVLWEPLGLARGSLPLGVSATLLVLPRPVALEEELAVVPGPAPGEQHGSEGGEPPGTLRDYRPGDMLALVHWKQSARADRLLVSDRERESRPRARLALLAGPGVCASHEDAEVAISVAAGIIQEWSARYRDLGLAVLVLPAAADGADGADGGSLVQWEAEGACSVVLLRVLAQLDLHGGDVASLAPAALREQGVQAGLRAGLAADVVVQAVASPGAQEGRQGSAGGDRGSGVGYSFLDPSVHGTLVLVGGTAGGGQEPAACGAVGEVPQGWQVLRVPAVQEGGGR